MNKKSLLLIMSVGVLSLTACSGSINYADHLEDYVHSMKYHDDLNAVEKTLKELDKLNIREKDKGNIILLLKLVMDSDRLANFVFFPKIDKRYFTNLEKLPFFSESCLNSFKNRKLIINSERKTVFDQLLGYICWSYDLYYDSSRDFVRENNCLTGLLNLIEEEMRCFNENDKDKMILILDDIKKQLEKDKLLC